MMLEWLDIPLHFLQYRLRIKRSSDSKKVKVANYELRIKRIWGSILKLPNYELNEVRIKRDQSVFEIKCLLAKILRFAENMA